MNNNEKNIVDKFLDSYTNDKNGRTETVRIYVKPNRFKSICGFAISLIFLILLLTLFTFSFMYFLILIGDLLVVIYYGLNLFTEKGFGIPKTIDVPIDELNEEETTDSDEL